MTEVKAVRGGRVVRVERDGGDLLLVIGGLRRYGLGWTARLRFAEAGTLRGVDERSASPAPPLHPGWDVEALDVDDARAVLRASRCTGPGDRGVVTYSLPCRAMGISVRPSLRGTLIRLASI